MTDAAPAADEPVPSARALLKERDYRLAAAAAVVFVIILAGLVVRAPSR